VTEQSFEVMSNNFSVCTCIINCSKKDGDNGIIIIDGRSGGGDGNHHYHHQP
jgi:hypothetical protein